MTTAGAIRLLVADDHELVRQGVVSMLAESHDFRVVGQASDGESAIAAYESLRPDVLIVDLRMPGVSGEQVIARVRSLDPKARIVVLTSYANPFHVGRALRAGAATVLPKDVTAEQLRRCLRDVVAGRAVHTASSAPDSVLTSRELEVLRLVADGRANKEIATALGISESTAKLHLKNLFAKLAVSSRTQALRRALELGLLDVG